MSILFPAPQNESDAGRLIPLKGPVADGSRPLLSQTAFDAVLNFAQAEDKANINLFTVPSAKLYSSWRVVSLRVIPCGDSTVGHGVSKLSEYGAKNCTVQIRLVVQPLDEHGMLGDQAFHLVYRVKGDPASTLPLLASELAELKEIARASGVDTNGVPLGVHPAFAGGLKDGPFLTRVSKFIQDHCRYEGLKEVAVFLTTQGAVGGSGGTVWHFFSVLLDPANAKQPLVGPIPLNDKGEFVQSQNGEIEVLRGALRTDSGVGAIQTLFTSTRFGPVSYRVRKTVPPCVNRFFCEHPEKA